MNPGRRKVAGETLCEALIPLHPVPTSDSAGMIVSQRSFQFKLIRASIRENVSLATLNYAQRASRRADSRTERGQPCPRVH